jgi:hypothetical protein
MRWLLIIFLGVFSDSAEAYIGPGMGAGVVATVIAVLSTIALGLAAIVYYPIKRIIKRARARRRDRTPGGS